MSESLTSGSVGGLVGQPPALPGTAAPPGGGSAEAEGSRLGRSRCAEALVRQAKLGASCRVQVPAEEGLTSHSYRVLQLWRKHDATLNETVEAYTGNHVARRGARTPQSLTQPRKIASCRWRWC